MKNGNIEILDLDFEYKLWKNKTTCMLTEVDLFIDRIHILKREHLNLKIDNFILELLNLQHKALKQINNTIRTHEQEIAFYAEDYPILTGHSHYVIHENIRVEMEKVMNRHQNIISEILPKLCYPMDTTQ